MSFDTLYLPSKDKQFGLPGQLNGNTLELSEDGNTEEIVDPSYEYVSKIQ